MVCLSCGLNESQTQLVLMHVNESVVVATGEIKPPYDMPLCLPCFKAKTGHDYSGDPTHEG
jgi:hypothetical protein